MRTLLSLLASLLLGSQAYASDTQNITQWHAVYQATLKTNVNSALSMLQDRYHTADTDSEKLYVSGLIYEYMSNINQPYYGSSQILDNHFAKLESKYIQALKERKNGNCDASVSLFSSLLQATKQQQDLESKALMNYQLCYTLNQQGQYHKSNFFCSSLMQQFSNGHPESIPSDLAIRVIANNFDFRGEYDIALNLYRRILNNMPAQSDTSGVYNDVGNLLSELGQFEQSEQYLIQALLARQLDAKPLEVAQVEHSLAAMYNKSKDYDKAISHYKNALTILDGLNYPYGQGLTYLGLGSAYIESGDLKSAVPMIRKALKLGEQYDNIRLQTESHLAAGSAYLKHDMQDKALEHGQAALNLSLTNSTSALQAKAQLLLSQVYGSLGEFSKALAHYKNYATLELANRDANNVKAIEALDLTKNEYEYDLQLAKINNERSLKLLEVEKLGDQQRAYNFAIFCLLILLIASLFVQRRTRIKSTLDTLTSSLNRSAIIDKIKDQCAKCSDDMRYVLILIDLDKFKLINDNYGHPTGDAVLRHVSKALKAKLNKDEYLGRLGGEEFVLLLKNVDEIDVPFRVQSIHKTISEKRIKTSNNQLLSVTASMAYLSTSKPLTNFDELYSILDQALYQAKRNGRNAIIDAYNEPIDLPPAAFESTTS
ncbi:GGDEF domain-containing protein [Vibrio alfacsensis]|uniref:tetratricopeptide repeat-containing diguanylate cyclase n=1 Tax=Vibrio alfacsensis TaxID=1074311 RepID=UPI001BEF2384|nr:diguanylate cyclase [Vibrio alfacsensis]BBM64604.1 GGDEF domain-containing protein [Vibrio alfacsensis]